MIPQQKDRKSKFIFVYILLFIFITSINNKNFHNKKLFSNNLIFEVNGLSYVDNQKLKIDSTYTNFNCLRVMIPMEGDTMVQVLAEQLIDTFQIFNCLGTPGDTAFSYSDTDINDTIQVLIPPHPY